MTTLHFSHALLPGGWARDVSVEVEAGLVTAVRTGCERAQRARTGLVALPGLANLHSHAFQRAMAGLGERRGAGRDSFWSWREHMFRLVERLGPDELEAIAALAFAEMLEGGFTAVVEFHYLHHAPDGRPYADRAEMARRVVAAAADTGIGLTLAPVLYTRAGFDDAAPGPAQRRFANDVEELVAIARDAHVALEALPHAQPALAAHSLRTVDPRSLDLLARVLPSAPLHVHAAEQVREVEQCRAALGARPVQWLLDHGADARWTLVHATHVDQTELAGLAASGAVVGLCPITEADLGDGLFPARAFLEAGGTLGVGSDSNVQVSPAGELRLLEQGQRLATRSRNVLAPPGASTGRALLEQALAGGALASGQATGAIAPGLRADIVALPLDDVRLIGRSGDAWIDTWVFSAGDAVVAEVWSAGAHVVSSGRHVRRADIERRYRAALAQLAA